MGLCQHSTVGRTMLRYVDEKSSPLTAWVLCYSAKSIARPTHSSFHPFDLSQIHFASRHADVVDVSAVMGISG